MLYPFECVSYAVEQGGRQAEAKWEAFINIVLTFPVSTMQFSVISMAWADSKRMFQVYFTHVATTTITLDNLL